MTRPIKAPDLSLGLLRASGRVLRNGRRTRALVRFLEDAGASHLLCEFGHVAAENGGAKLGHGSAAMLAVRAV